MLKAQFQQRLAQAPESVTKVLLSGEGCDVSLLDKALDTGYEEEYLACAETETLKAEISLAKVEQALVEKRIQKAELTDRVDQKLAQSETNDTTIDVLDKEIAGNNNALMARLLEK